MSFISVEFLLFVIISLLIYYIVPKKAQWLILLLVSCVFYSVGGVSALCYLAITTLTTYISGIGLSRLNSKIEALKGEENKLKRVKFQKKLIVLFSCLMNFGMLFFFKYWDVFAKDINGKLSCVLPTFNLLLPLGISFYIFQSIGYVIDVYRKKVEAEKNILKYALFTSFFPQMVQGPISRFGNLKTELFSKHQFSFENMEKGIQLVLWGLFKKLLIADRAAVVVNLVFDKYQDYSGAVIIFGGILYCIQLYCDFSGGIDIARGVAKMFGISLIENFKRPIFATSLSEFWRRWHISLGSWMKDYVFYPLSLSKPFIKLGKFIRSHIKGKAGQIIPVSIATFIVYFLIGIWHGASYKYIAFGIWNGAIITASLLLEPLFSTIRNKLHISSDSKKMIAFRTMRTSIIVLMGRFITRAANLGTLFEMVKLTLKNFGINMLFDGTLLNLGITAADFAVIAIGIIIILAVEFMQERKISVSSKLKSKPYMVQFALITLFIVALVAFGFYKGDYIASEFIYKQF